MTDRLYFNGIDATTGAYGLEPMTPADLARRIIVSQYQRSERLQTLESALQQHLGGEAKLLALVDLLVQSNLDALQDTVSSHNQWAEDVARKVLGVLLGNREALPGEIDQLQRRLHKRPRETLRMVAGMLSRDQGYSLAKFLSGDESDVALLRVSLERRLDQAISQVQRRYLSDASEVVEPEGYLRASWIVSLGRALERLPVPSVQALTGSEPVKTSARRLAAELSKQEAGVTTPNPCSVPWIEPLVRAAMDDSAGLWLRIVRALAHGFEMLRRERVVVRKDRLRAILRSWLSTLQRTMTGQLGVVPWIDPRDLKEAGWGVIFPATMAPDRQEAIQAALKPLLALRREQAGAYFRLYAGKEGYRPGDTARAFMGRTPRLVEVANPANPPATGVPYYCLLVGGPEAIPFEFQYQLDVQYAVGRLDFGSDIAAYARYADNVVARETGAFTHARRAVFFGVNNPNDEATALSTRYLINPLHRRLGRLTKNSDWQLLNVAPELATKANLSRLLSLKPPPALLFAAGHGVELGPEHGEQKAVQGALLCQDWEGTIGELGPTTYFSAQDVT